MYPLVTFVTLFGVAMTANAADRPELLEAVDPVATDMASAATELPADRREILDRAARYVAENLNAGEEVQLTFICTHNSRRSHLAQIWAQVAADYYGLDGVKTYSGGTEATACNPRTVRALRRAGIEVVRFSEGTNPKYLVQYAENRAPHTVFSKVYKESPNPQSDYAAMMCCSDVDERCPVVFGAEARIPLHYIDPKVADDSPDEAETYDERCRQIGTEMFYVMNKAAELTD